MVILALARRRQEDHEFKVSLRYIVRALNKTRHPDHHKEE